MTREEAINILWMYDVNFEPHPAEEVMHAIDMAIEALRQPERKTGRWTKDNACEFCGFQPWYEGNIHTLSYCPNCGAKMER